MHLTDRDKELLDFAARRYRYVGAQETALLEEFGLSGTRFWQRINVLLDDPAALAYAPVTVRRLQRLRRARQHARRAS